MRQIVCALALSLAAALPAAAKDAPAQAEPAQPAKTVYVCDNSAMARRTFEREHGAAMEFVTAKDAAANSGKWTTPKCMKPAEARKLKELAGR